MSELQFFGHIIDNEEVESLDGARFDVWNPWTREVWAPLDGFSMNLGMRMKY